MRILLINQFFPPDAAATGVLLGDVAEGLFAAGADVRVICGKGAYACSPQRHGEHGEGTEVRRLGTLPFSHQKAGKTFSYLSFLTGAVIGALTGPRPDVVVTLTTPPGLAWIGWILQKLRGARHVIWEMDVYPDVAVDLGMKSAGYLGFLLDFPRRRADAVIALGECMKERLTRRGVRGEKIFVCENWADGFLATNGHEWTRMLRVVYSGNLGLAHEVETILEVIRRFQGDSRFEFVFAGGGPRRAALEERCRGYSNVVFEGWAERASERLASAQVGLVTQKPETVGSVVPSKTYGLMAAGRPVLYIGPGEATPARVVRRFECGWHFECGDADGVVRLLSDLPERTEEIRAAGLRGRRAFEEFYCREVGVGRVMDVILRS